MDNKMAVTYTNRKGRKYFLCLACTKTGKVRYFFAKDLKGEPVEEIPEGYEIRENVNGIVSLSKVRPELIRGAEIAAVESALHDHPLGKKYRVDVKAKEITIYEQLGLDMHELASIWGSRLGIPATMTKGVIEHLEEKQHQYAQYTPVMKFILKNKERRLFGAQRMCYLVSVDDWIDIEHEQKIEHLAKELVPTLGTDEFFRLI